MGESWTPKDADEARAAVGEALAQGRSLELVGTGTRRGFGRPVEAGFGLDLSALRGVVTYQPEELILAARPAPPMSEIAAMLAERGQCLAFEPPDFGPLWGLPAGQGTLGGAMMTGRGGPRRLTAGGPRDHCLGLKGVNGFGEAFAAGGRVVKNVTGFDVAKLATGSFGTLCVVTELTLKVLPAPPQAQTLAIRGLTDEAAMGVMAKALGCPAQVSSAAHLPADVAARYPKPAFDIGRERFDPPLSRARTAYGLVQFALLLGMTTHFLGLAAQAGLGILLGYALVIALSLTVLGAWWEGRPAAAWLEGLRVSALALAPLLVGGWFALPGAPVVAAFATVFGLSALALAWVSRAGGGASSGSVAGHA